MLWLKRLAAVALLLLIMVYGILFSMENDSRIAVDLLFFQLPKLPFAVWLILAFALGGLGGLLASSVSLVKARGRQVLINRQLDRTKQELNSIRTSAMKH